MSWLSRFRHSRGFGVHSPFAFRLITEVVRERCPYYDYEQLPNRRDRLIYRLAARFSPTEIADFGRASARAAAMACPSAKYQSAEPEFVVTSADYSGNEPVSALESGAVVMVVGRHGDMASRLREVLDRSGYGMVFLNERDCWLFTPFRHLPRQDFNINL